MLPRLAPPVLRFPRPDSVGLPLSLTLHWHEAPQHQQALGYRVQLEREADPVVLVDTAGVTVLSHQISGLEAGTLYTWRVCTLNGEGACGDWAQRRFTTIAGQPLLALSPSPPQPLAFHAVAAGTTAEDTLTIANAGAAPLSMSLTLVDHGGGSGPAVFALAPEAVTDTLLAAGASYAVPVRFTPSEALSYSGALSLTHNAPGLSPVTIPLEGTGLDGPTLSLRPGSLAFGNVVVGDVVSDTVWVSNSGTGTLTGSYALPAGSAFRFADGSWGPVSLSVDAGAPLAVAVFFEAPDVGSYADTLTFYDAGGVQVLGAVSLSGQGTLPASATGRFYYLRDHLSSVRATVNEEGAVVHYDDYYPFGMPMPGRSLETPEAPRERFTGHEQEVDIDPDFKATYYAGARYYDGLIGRWPTVDPKEELFPSHSPYNYVFNNPINITDPDGQMPCPECEVLKEISDTIVGAIEAIPDELGKIADTLFGGAAETVVEGGAGAADIVSDGSTIAAIGGIVAAPFTKGASLIVTAEALTVGTAADVTSTVLKGVDAAAMDGSAEDFVNQAAKTTINAIPGAAANRFVSKRVAAKATRGRAATRAFKDPKSKKFVKDAKGLSATAAADATGVVLGGIGRALVPDKPIETLQELVKDDNR